MSDEIQTIDPQEENDKSPKGETGQTENKETVSDRHPKHHLSGMYQDWFLDYASYVILERAVPHVSDGLKPVQRRIMHAMKRLDDGRYNKVANIIGNTMQFHPHGDASIGDALVQLGQKDLLVDTQGNWGNVHTGDGAAAPRYIEARLSKFALDILFNPKITEWKLSYDGRNKEPITLPVKYPLLLAQGVEGIAVGLASKILPHNFRELLDASIAHLKGKEFELFPDFPTGGFMDASRYNDGIRGGQVKVRAKISKLDSKTLVIEELPYGKTTTSLIESILKAYEKGKIKIKKIDDNTAEKVEILVHLPAGVSSDKTIDALYAFSDCEVSISPNSCVIQDNKPHFFGVTHILKMSTDQTVSLLRRELEIRMGELRAAWHFASLERIFIENRIYLDIEQCETFEAIIKTIDNGLKPHIGHLQRAVTREDIIKLTEIKIKRISKYDSNKAEEYISSIEEEIEEIRNNIENIIPYTIAWFQSLKRKYGAGKERRTEIRSFETIEATKVAVANQKLFLNRGDGFMGTSLKKDEFLFNCSDIDDIILFFKDGRYLVTRVSEKAFIGKDVLHVGIFRKNDKRTIFNVIYRDGKNGTTYMKRFAVFGVTRDKEYNVTKGTPGSRVLYFSSNPNGEAETVKVVLKPKARLRGLFFEQDMGDLAVKGRQSMGNILTKNPIHKITLRKRGCSTLGGRKIWWDSDVKRLNTEKRGAYLGEFQGDEKILIITKAGEFYHTSFDLENHYEGDILIVEKYDSEKLWSAVSYDGEHEYFYIKRFKLELSLNKRQRFIGDHPKSYLVQLTHVDYPRFEVKFGGEDKDREKMIIEAVDFIGVKSFKARGKRLTTFQVAKVKEIEPIQEAEEVTQIGGPASEVEDQEESENGQMSLEF